MAVAYGRPTSALIQRRIPERDFVPKNFSEMYQHYYVYVLKLLVQQGIDYQDADDYAQVLFIKMDEKGLLSQFDPSHESGNGRPAVFSTMLSGFVVKYAMGFRKRQRINKDREMNLIDQDAGSGSGEADLSDAEYSPWLDVYGPVFEEEYGELAIGEFRTIIRAHLRTAHTGRKDSQLDLVALFDEIDLQVALDGKYDTGVLSTKFGVSRTTVHKWLERLRVEVAKAVKEDG